MVTNQKAKTKNRTLDTKMCPRCVYLCVRCGCNIAVSYSKVVTITIIIISQGEKHNQEDKENGPSWSEDNAFFARRDACVCVFFFVHFNSATFGPRKKNDFVFICLLAPLLTSELLGAKKKIPSRHTHTRTLTNALGCHSSSSCSGFFSLV